MTPIAKTPSAAKALPPDLFDLDLAASAGGYACSSGFSIRSNQYRTHPREEREKAWAFELGWREQNLIARLAGKAA